MRKEEGKNNNQMNVHVRKCTHKYKHTHTHKLTQINTEYILVIIIKELELKRMTTSTI